MCIINQSDLLLPITTCNFKVTLRDVISVRHTKCSVNLSMSQKRISEFLKNPKILKFQGRAWMIQLPPTPLAALSTLVLLSSLLTSSLLQLNLPTKKETLRTVQELGLYVSNLQPQTRGLFKEVEKLLQLCFCLPVSTASSERSFSALRCLKTWLRNSVTQKRLTHMALLHVHRDILDHINVQDLMREFISVTPERKAMFGVPKSS